MLSAAPCLQLKNLFAFLCQRVTFFLSCRDPPMARREVLTPLRGAPKGASLLLLPDGVSRLLLRGCGSAAVRVKVTDTVGDREALADALRARATAPLEGCNKPPRQSRAGRYGHCLVRGSLVDLDRASHVCRISSV